MNKRAMSEAQTSFRARFSVAEFVEICSGTDVRLELVDGELERMNPPLGTHTARQSRIGGMLMRLFDERAVVEVGIQIDDATVLTCDAALLHAPIIDERFRRPDEVALAIEVAQSTVARDRGLKRERYAAAGIAEYWVVDGIREVVHVHRDPIGGDYADVHTVRFGEPLAVPGTDATIVIV